MVKILFLNWNQLNFHIMKYFVFIICILFGGKSLSQVSLPQETGKIIVDQYIKGYQTGDTLRMKSMAHPNITLQTMFLNEDQENALLYISPSGLYKYIAANATQEKFEFRLTDYVVHSDGNLGHVWAPYFFYKNGKFAYCGSFSFSLTYTDDSWKILNVAESRRIGSCFDHD